MCKIFSSEHIEIMKKLTLGAEKEIEAIMARGCSGREW